MKTLKLTEQELKLLVSKLVQSTSDENLENPKLLVSKLYDKLYDTLKEKKYIVVEYCKYSQEKISEFEYNSEYEARNKYDELFESYNCVQGHIEVELLNTGLSVKRN